MLIVLIGIIIVLVLLLFWLVSSLDMRDLRRHPEGLLSPNGVWLVVGGGFLAGFGYGVLAGTSEDVRVLEWLSRGFIDGLVVACAGAFYLGFLQRKRKRREEERGSGDDGSAGEG